MATTDIGKHGEDLAVKYLEDQGLIILERNFRNGRFGEIDIISKENNVLIFIEVKAFARSGMLRPAAAVTPNKQEKIKQAAQRYLFEQRLRAVPCRFDVIEIYWQGRAVPEIKWLKDAFR